MTDRYEVGTRVLADLDLLFELIRLDTQTVVDTDDIATVANHFQSIRGLKGKVDDAVKLITDHVEQLSREIIPTMMFNKRQKSTNIVGLGRLTINQRWSASILDPLKGFEWLRQNGEGGIIKESVHHETLGVVAKNLAKVGKPLPDDLFKVSTSNYTSITPA
jgi:hypothetical protein